MNGGIVLSLVLCVILLTFRYWASAGKTPQRSSARSRIRMLRILVAAAIALAAVGYRLQRHAFDLDGRKDYQPSVIERIVMSFAK